MTHEFPINPTTKKRYRGGNVLTLLATAVASTKDLAAGTTRPFSAPGIVGFVSEHDGNLHAVSGVCTHMGCLLRVNAEAGRLDCPCHGTAFDLDGTVVFSQLTPAPPSLVKIGVRRTGDRIEVLVPPGSRRNGRNPTRVTGARIYRRRHGWRDSTPSTCRRAVDLGACLLDDMSPSEAAASVGTC